MNEKTYRVAVIGSTGRGDYGHGLDRAFIGVERARIVAVADDNPAGLERAGERLGVAHRYGDYRTMLDRERPDIVCLGPRWLTEREAMLEAIVAAGCHVYCEKPFHFHLATVDRLAARCREAGIHVAMAHQWRAMPPVERTLARLQAGEFGRVLRMRARPKDDARGGGEELLVHGTHWFDLMLAIAGPPRWVSAHIQVGARPAELKDRREGSEPIGPILGESILATFGFDRGVLGMFDSTANTAPRRPAGSTEPPAWDSVYGLTVECEKATLQWRQPGDVYIYPAAGVLPDLDALRWEKIWVEDWHFTPEHQPRRRSDWIEFGNRRLAQDLIASVESRRPPRSPLQHAVWITEMVQGCYTSHLAEGRRLSMPLQERWHPLIDRA